MVSLIKNIIAFICILIIFISFTGCSCKEKIVYVDRIQEVNIPIKCKVPEIEKPKKGNNLSETSLNIKEYILTLEAAINKCK